MKLKWQWLTWVLITLFVYAGFLKTEQMAKDWAGPGLFGDVKVPGEEFDMVIILWALAGGLWLIYLCIESAWYGLKRAFPKLRNRSSFAELLTSSEE